MKSIAVIEECLWGDKPWVCPTDPSRASGSFVEIGDRTTSLVLSWQKTAKAPNRHRMLLGVRYYWRVALSRVNHVKYCQIMLYIVHTRIWGIIYLLWNRCKSFLHHATTSCVLSYNSTSRFILWCSQFISISWCVLMEQLIMIISVYLTSWFIYLTVWRLWIV